MLTFHKEECLAQVIGELLRPARYIHWEKVGLAFERMSQDVFELLLEKYPQYISQLLFQSLLQEQYRVSHFLGLKLLASRTQAKWDSKMLAVIAFGGSKSTVLNELIVQIGLNRIIEAVLSMLRVDEFSELGFAVLESLLAANPQERDRSTIFILRRLSVSSSEGFDDNCFCRNFISFGFSQLSQLTVRKLPFAELEPLLETVLPVLTRAAYRMDHEERVEILRSFAMEWFSYRGAVASLHGVLIPGTMVLLHVLFDFQFDINRPFLYPRATEILYGLGANTLQRGLESYLPEPGKEPSSFQRYALKVTAEQAVQEGNEKVIEWILSYLAQILAGVSFNVPWYDASIKVLGASALPCYRRWLTGADDLLAQVATMQMYRIIRECSEEDAGIIIKQLIEDFLTADPIREREMVLFQRLYSFYGNEMMTEVVLDKLTGDQTLTVDQTAYLLQFLLGSSFNFSQYSSLVDPRLRLAKVLLRHPSAKLRRISVRILIGAMEVIGSFQGKSGPADDPHSFDLADAVCSKLLDSDEEVRNYVRDCFQKPEENIAAVLVLFKFVQDHPEHEESRRFLEDRCKEKTLYSRERTFGLHTGGIRYLLQSFVAEDAVLRKCALSVLPGLFKCAREDTQTEVLDFFEGSCSLREYPQELAVAFEKLTWAYPELVLKRDKLKSLVVSCNQLNTFVRVKLIRLIAANDEEMFDKLVQQAIGKGDYLLGRLSQVMKLYTELSGAALANALLVFAEN